MERIFNARYPIDEPVQAFSMTTPLMHCAAMGSPEGLEIIIARNPNVNAKDRAGRTALHYCCKGGNIQNLRLMLERGIFMECIESRTCGGVTPLMCAVQSGNIYVVGECLNRGFNPFA